MSSLSGIHHSWPVLKAKKELLGLYLSQSEGAALTFLLTDLHNRGVKNPYLPVSMV